MIQIQQFLPANKDILENFWLHHFLPQKQQTEKLRCFSVRWLSIIWSSVVQSDAFWLSIIWSGVIWSDVVWSSVIWLDVIWSMVFGRKSLGQRVFTCHLSNSNSDPPLLTPFFVTILTIMSPIWF